MDFLKVTKNRIVDTHYKKVSLRGYCIGGWMNMENFINGYPGSEHGMQRAIKNVLGPAKAEYFFNKLLDYFVTADDIIFLKECGVNVIRLPINYRHFEKDDNPYKYTENGFKQLEKIITICEENEIYVIIDLHAVQGWQNTDWHCDNSSRHTFFWDHHCFQERFIALWKELARRFKNYGCVAGYNIMNEPLSNAPFGRFDYTYIPAWDKINSIYRRTVKAIRKIDPHHIIFLEGDYFSRLFSGFDAPFDNNIVYSSHNYNEGGFGPGKYPGIIQNRYWNKSTQIEVFLKEEGTIFTRKHNVPLWIGEFGSVYNGPENEINYRLKAMDDQISVFQEHDAHWTAWTYKDIGIMGLVYLNPESEYIDRIKHILKAKRQLNTDFWMYWITAGKVRQKLDKIVDLSLKILKIPKENRDANKNYLAQASLSGYLSARMQILFAEAFKGLSCDKIDQVLKSFSFKLCLKREALIKIIKKILQD